VTGQLTQVAKQ